ncbi:MAG TPA: hypothetical protein VMM37_09665 [Bacteroidota bacterium]|nr:hypothetical protein [Bacteroidota bacterium]
MEELILAIIVTAAMYAVLRFFKISWLKQSFPSSFIYLAGVFAWCGVLAALASVYSFVSMLIDLVGSFDADSLFPVVVFLIVVGIAVKLLYDRKEILDIAHMIPFLRTAILFKPYDAKRQELFERNERMMMAEARRSATARAESGQPEEEVLDISEEGHKEGAESSASGQSTAQTSELDILKRGEAIDISELFKSSTAKLPAHPLYAGVSVVRIDPVEKDFRFNLVFPAVATEPELTPDKRQRCTQGVYQVMQAITAEQWLKPFTPFFSTISVNCLRTKKDEFDMVRETAFMSVRVGMDKLRLSRGRPFNSAEFAKIASVTNTE